MEAVFRICMRFIRIQPKISMQIRIQGANRSPMRIRIQADPDPGPSVKKFDNINYEHVDIYNILMYMVRTYMSVFEKTRRVSLDPDGVNFYPVPVPKHWVGGDYP
jgi:hypothetical protein